MLALTSTALSATADPRMQHDKELLARQLTSDLNLWEVSQERRLALQEAALEALRPARVSALLLLDLLSVFVPVPVQVALRELLKALLVMLIVHS